MVTIELGNLSFVKHAEKHQAGGGDGLPINTLPVTGDVDLGGQDITNGGADLDQLSLGTDGPATSFSDITDDITDAQPIPEGATNVTKSQNLAKDGSEDLTPALEAELGNASEGDTLVFEGDGKYGINSSVEMFNYSTKNITVDFRGAEIVGMGTFSGEIFQGGNPEFNNIPEGFTARNFRVIDTDQRPSDQFVAVASGGMADRVTFKNIVYPDEIVAEKTEATQSQIVTVRGLSGATITIDSLDVLVGNPTSYSSNQGTGTVFVNDPGEASSDTGTGEERTLRIQNCYIKGQTDNGLYCSKGPRVKVDNCTLKDCDSSHVRLGEKGSSVTNTDIYVNQPDSGRTFDDPTPIWLENQGGITVDNCSIYLRGPASAIKVDSTCASATVSNTDIVQYQGNPSIVVNAFTTTEDPLDNPQKRVTVRDTRIEVRDDTQDGGDSDIEYGNTRCIDTDRDDVLFANVQAITGAAQVLRVNGGSATVRDCEFESSNFSVITVTPGTGAPPTIIENTDVIGGNITLDACSDCNLSDLDASVSVNLTGSEVRPRWNGVIGGGPLGGANLASTFGQYGGDKAMNSSYIEAIYDDANTQWKLTNENTVTPT